MDDRSQRIYDAVARRDGRPDPFQRLRAVCKTCVDVLSVTGAGIMLMARREHQATAYATDPVIQRLEDLQNAAGEGPCLDAYNLARPVMAPDLEGDARRRWPILVTAALEAGMRALFAFPLALDDSCVGALDLYRDRAGPLRELEVADARLLAAMATREVLAMQQQAVPGSLPAQIGDLSGDRVAIAQATGMTSARLAVGIFEAGERLRAFAHGLERPLAAVARDIVERTLAVE